MTFDDATFWIWISVWPLFGIREAWIWWRKRRGLDGRWLSIVAKERGPHVSAVIFMWTSQPSHWWWPVKEWGPMWAGYVFWAIPLALLGWDVATWREDAGGWPGWKRYARHPILWMVVGVLAGHFLFGQKP